MSLRFKIIIKTLLIGVSLQLLTLIGFAQNQPITIEECYQLARINYPLIKKEALINKTRDYSIANATKLFLPQITIFGQASYQSETLGFPAAMSGLLPSIDKDQYRLQGEVTQTIFGAGVSRNQQNMAKVNSELQSQQLEVDLYTLRNRINQIYFSILLLGEQLKNNELRKIDLKNVVEQMEAALQNGTAFKSSVNELKAELSLVESANIELLGNRQSYINMLSLFTKKNIAPTQLVVPLPEIKNYIEIKRPELSLFDINKKSFAIQEKQLHAALLPKINAFFQGAYGRPTLNMLNNKFDFWYIGGLRLNWSLESLYTLGNNKRILNIKSQLMDAEKETFLFNTKLALSQQQAQIKKYQDLIIEDEKAIILRGLVKASAKAQLENGIITVRDYISQINAENLSRQTQIVHQTRLLQAQYNLKNTSGN